VSLRVLVVDDTVLYRHLIAEVLGELDGVEVIGSAAGGRMALARMESLRPDLVTLDIEMPDLNGLQVLEEMQRRNLTPGVVVLSAVTVRGGEMTIRALQLGAFDFVTKPSGGTPEANRAVLRSALDPVVRAFTRRREIRGILRRPGAAGTESTGAAGAKSGATTAPPESSRGPGRTSAPTPASSTLPSVIRPLLARPPMSAPGGPPVSLRGVSRPAGLSAPPAGTGRLPAPDSTSRTESVPGAGGAGLDDVSRRMSRLSRTARPELVLIGISTGGPNALTRMLPQLPGSLGVPVLVVQHMPPLFTKSLADSLAPKCALRVKEAESGEPARPGSIYIAPGGRQMKVISGPGGDPVIEITDDPAENNCRPAVDYLFRSAANQFAGRAVAVIMTGMGGDGTLGMKLLKRGGALTIAQDEATCIVYGMPREAVQAGVVDLVLPLDEIAEGISRAVRGVAA
jgi:two-component system chemotaxis response regulator CheB